MKTAYGTYAMPTLPLEEAFAELARIGYDGVEICISERHAGATPEQMDSGRRKELAAALAEKGLGVPALFVTGHLFHADPAGVAETLERLRICAQLARDLGVPGDPVLAMGFGARTADWDNIRAKMADQLAQYGALAEAEGFMLAGEAHCNAAVDRSERVVWLMEEVAHPRVRYHFDIVHLFLAGEDEREAVFAVLPYTAHTHITDARRLPEGKFELVLLGDGELDSVKYMTAMKDAGWDSFITLEVSTMVWGKEGYDPVAAAEKSYRNLTRAFEQAGVERG